MFRGFIGFIFCFLMIFSVNAADNCCRIKGNAGAVDVECTGTAFGQTAIPIAMLTSNPSINNVPEVCDAMDQLGFKSVFSIPCTNETVVAENRKVDGFTYKAIVYHQKQGGPNFLPKIAVSALYNADGTKATNLDYLKLVLDGKLDYPAYAGVWLPKRSYPPAMEYNWRAGAKIEKVADLKDGRIINLVRIPNSTPFFSVEKHGMVMKKDVMVQEVVTPRHNTERNKIGSFGHKKWIPPTEASLRKEGYLKDNEQLLRVVAVEEMESSESVTDVDIVYETEQVIITKERQVPQMSMTVYPFVE